MPTNYINPLDGHDPVFGRYENLGHTEWAHRGFVRDIYNQGANQRAPREPDVEIMYFPPFYEGSASQWPYLKIGLKIYEPPQVRQYGLLPYYYELVPANVLDLEGRPLEQLTLHVDRNIEILFPEGTENQGNGLYSLRIPGSGVTSQFFPLGHPPPLRVSVKRYQRLVELPQSPQDIFGINRRPRNWAWKIDEYTRAEIVKTENSNETLLSFYLETHPIIGRQVVPGFEPIDIREARIDLVGELSLAYWNKHFPGAYHYKISGPPPGGSEQRWRIDILASRNIKAILKINAFGLDAASFLSRDALLVVLRESDFWQYFNLRLNFNVDLLLVPRKSTHDSPLPRETFAIDSDHSGMLTIESLRDQRREEFIDLIQFTLGFVPIIGDLMDVGEFLVALTTSRDLQGRPVDTGQLLIMTLALLPGIPSAAARLRGRINSAREALSARNITLENVADRLESTRPRLAAALRSGSLEGLAQQLVGSAANHTNVAVLGHIRDEEILDVIAGKGRR